MSTRILKTRIQNKIDSEARWKNHPEFIPLAGEAIIYTDVNGDSDKVQIKFGDGITTIDKLPFATSPEAGNVIIENVPSQSGTLTYNGSEQSPVWSNFDETQMYISGITTGTNAGEYTAYFTPLAGYCWSDGTTAAKEVAWKIDRATPTITVPNSVTITASSNATFTVQTNSPGTITATVNTTSVATVSVSGKTITVKYVGLGTTVVTVTVGGTTNYKLVSANVNVTAKVKENLNSYTWEQLANMAMNYEFMNKFDVGDSKDIKLLNVTNPPVQIESGTLFDGDCAVVVLHMSSTAAGEYVYFGCFNLPVFGTNPVCFHTSNMSDTLDAPVTYLNSNAHSLLGALDKNKPASGTIMSLFPANMRKYFSPMWVDAAASSEYLAIPSEAELTGTADYSGNQYDSVILMEGIQFQLYAAGNSYSAYDYSGSWASYWTRSTATIDPTMHVYVPAQPSPAPIDITYQNETHGIVCFFCISADGIPS